VYNRPEEIDELLASLSVQTYGKEFEIVIIEDGSAVPCGHIIEKFKEFLNITYHYKANTGPGDSRNFGMRMAKGEYFLIFDSDCIIPAHYLDEVERELNLGFVDFFGGPDKALDSFSDIQKAINFAMTSFITTGGIRGGSEKIDKFQPRSFNMGISRKAFVESEGFGNIHPGEDPDLAIRLWKLGCTSRLFQNAYVYHKRRIDWKKFSVQVNKFGKARPILNEWHPQYVKPAYFLPVAFVLGLYVSLTFSILIHWYFILPYAFYCLLVATVSAVENRSIRIGILSVEAILRQFIGYGHGFMLSFYRISIQRMKPEAAFPELFF
jgi:glycosyltransferase involved in cell wall biosynthesis